MLLTTLPVDEFIAKVLVNDYLKFIRDIFVVVVQSVIFTMFLDSTTSVICFLASTLYM